MERVTHLMGHRSRKGAHRRHVKILRTNRHCAGNGWTTIVSLYLGHLKVHPLREEGLQGNGLRKPISYVAHLTLVSPPRRLLFLPYAQRYSLFRLKKIRLIFLLARA